MRRAVDKSKLWRQSNIKCVFLQKLSILITKTHVKQIIAYKIYGTVKIIKSKLIIVILKEPKGFRAPGFSANF